MCIRGNKTEEAKNKVTQSQAQLDVSWILQEYIHLGDWDCSACVLLPPLCEYSPAKIPCCMKMLITRNTLGHLSLSGRIAILSSSATKIFLYSISFFIKYCNSYTGLFLVSIRSVDISHPLSLTLLVSLPQGDQQFSHLL